MGREILLEKVNKNAKRIIIGGVILFTLGFLLSSFFILAFSGLDPMLIISAFPLISGLIMIIIGVKLKRNPMTAKCFKMNRQLLEQADELFNDIVYQDDFVIFSNRVIASKKDITQMSYFDDIIWIYESKTSYNMVTAVHDVLISTFNYTMNISVYGKGKKTKYDLLDRIYQLCPNARIGYSQENLVYYNEMKQSYDNNKK